MRRFVFLLAFTPIAAFAQVGDIKGSSSSNSGDEGKVGAIASTTSFFVDFFFNGLGEWQKERLGQEQVQPAITSLEFYTQAAVQPSRYYVVWPRVRANWGLFSTDFRINYLIEDDLDGYQHLSTSDWQVLQFNLIELKHITGRIGYGFMHENFSEGKTFGELGMMLNVRAADHHLEGGVEYRVAKDNVTGAVPRREINGQVQYRILARGRLQGYLTGGATFQRYYGSTDVWGFTSGVCLKVF